MKFVVTGIGTEIGKTIVSAILTAALEASYWKPIESGCEGPSDLDVIRQFLISKNSKIYKSCYSFKAPLSIHSAARLEGVTVDSSKIQMPSYQNNLVIETCGGPFVPITEDLLSYEIFKKFKAKWIIVSKHYLGSIHHTLSTVEALKNKGIDPLGIIFNGKENKDSERAILKFSKLPVLGRLLPEAKITKEVINNYATSWKKSLWNCLAI